MADGEIVQANLDDMQFLIDCARVEGWNPGLCDARPFYYTDPNGYFIYKLENMPIGCISAVAYSPSYGFMGFYIVLPEYRKRGYGLKLWKHAISYLGNRSIGLDGVVAQQDNYKKSDFAFFYNNIRFGGSAKGKKSSGLCPLDAVSFAALAKYDAAVCGFDREIFLQHWITMSNSQGFAKISNGALLGYGVIRKCAKGYKIGPLFADNVDIAEEVFLALTADAEGQDIFFDAVQTHPESVSLAKKYHLSPVFETARMYKGAAPNQDLSKVFGVTTFELG